MQMEEVAVQGSESGRGDLRQRGIRQWRLGGRPRSGVSVKQANKNLCSQFLAQKKWIVGGENKITTNLGGLKGSERELFFFLPLKKIEYGP